MSLDEIREARLNKLKTLKERGINPYPEKTQKDFDLKEAVDNFSEILEKNKSINLVGRIMSIRGQGAVMFFDINDGTSKFQVMCKRGGFISDDKFNLFKDLVDIGDFVEVKGLPFLTKSQEKTIELEDWKMLSKSLKPLPEKWHGLQNNEERYRKRYLDLLMNEDLKDIFFKKALFWKVAREFVEKEGFIEVHTPSLELTTGGAEAEPFKTHHNDFDIDLYLRISVGELWQKKLMAASFPKTYEIGRVYRNEGTSPEHLQEFTNMEFYAAYLNMEEGKSLIKNLYIKIAKEVFGKTAFNVKGYSFDLADEWEEYDYTKTIEDMTGINIFKSSEVEIKNKLNELKVEYDGKTKERMIDSLWKYCRRKISGPGFLINHPKIVAPLSKVDSDNENITKTVQVIIAGSEIGRAHCELNDPIDQTERFKEQQKLLESGDNEAMMPDYEFVEMLEYGMPPTFGFGFGERLFSILSDKTIRETTLFPLMRPKNK